MDHAVALGTEQLHVLLRAPLLPGQTVVLGQPAAFERPATQAAATARFASRPLLHSVRFPYNGVPAARLRGPRKKESRMYVLLAALALAAEPADWQKPEAVHLKH